MSFSNERGGYNPERTEALAAATFDELLAAVERKLSSGETLTPETRERLQKILEYQNVAVASREMENESAETLPEEVRQLVKEINKQLYGSSHSERELFLDKYGSNRVDIENAMELRSGRASRPELQDSGPGGHLRIKVKNQTYLVPFSPQNITGHTPRFFSKDIYDFEADDYKRDKDYEKMELMEPAQITQSGGKSWIVNKKGKVRLH